MQHLLTSQQIISIGFKVWERKTCLCNAARRQKVLLRNQFPHIRITLFHLSIFVSVCTVWALSLCCGGWSIFQWSVISVLGLFIPPVYIKDLRWAVLPSLQKHCAYMHSSGHICTDTSYSIMRPILLPQLTQLGQQTALHNSRKLPSCPVPGPAAPVSHAHL